MRIRHGLIGVAAAATLTVTALGAGVAAANTTSSVPLPANLTAPTSPTDHRLGGVTIFDTILYCGDTNGDGWPSVGECIHQLG